MEQGTKGPSFCFAAAGWLKVWYYGVAKALRERVDLTNVRFAGSSAGSLVSICLLTDVDFDQLMDFTVGCVQRCRSSPLGPFRLSNYLDECYDLFYKPNYLPYLQNRLFVYVTDLPSFGQRCVSRFHSHEELHFWIKASCNIPLFVGMPKNAGEYVEGGQWTWVFDGGARTMCPMLDDDSITISVFGKADIRPSRSIPLQYGIYPPPVSVVKDLYLLGYHDTNVWLSNAAYTTKSLRNLGNLGRLPSCPAALALKEKPGQWKKEEQERNWERRKEIRDKKEREKEKKRVRFTGIGMEEIREEEWKWEERERGERRERESVDDEKIMPISSFPERVNARHKLRIGVELNPPPKTRMRDFIFYQITRSIWEITLLLFSAFFLFPLIFISTGFERIVSLLFANILLLTTTFLHIFTLCQSKEIEQKIYRNFSNVREKFALFFDLRIWMGNFFPAFSHFIGTRTIDHDEFVSLSSLYSFLQNTPFLKKYAQKGEGGKDEREGERGGKRASE